MTNIETEEIIISKAAFLAQDSYQKREINTLVSP